MLADHGLTDRQTKHLGNVPSRRCSACPQPAGDRCAATPPVPHPAALPPVAASRRPLTQAAPLRLRSPPARPVRRCIGARRRTLLPADIADEHAAAATTATRLAAATRSARQRAERQASSSSRSRTTARPTLRFGDDQHGCGPSRARHSPRPTASATASPATSAPKRIAHIVTDDSGDRSACAIRCRRGRRRARDASSDVRQRAPDAFRTQERAVTADDYAEVTRAPPEVQRAAAHIRWTGSWHTVFVTVDRLGGAAPSTMHSRPSMRRHLERYRMAGHDLEVDGRVYVPLEIEMHVCVEARLFPQRRQGGAATSLQQPRSAGRPPRRVSSRQLHLRPAGLPEPALRRGPGGGRRGFGRRSPAFSARATPDRKRARATASSSSAGWRSRGCDNDPNFPERGVFRLTIGGGR